MDIERIKDHESNELITVTESSELIMLKKVATNLGCKVLVNVISGKNFIDYYISMLTVTVQKDGKDLYTLDKDNQLTASTMIVRKDTKKSKSYFMNCMNDNEFKNDVLDVINYLKSGNYCIK